MILRARAALGGDQPSRQITAGVSDLAVIIDRDPEESNRFSGLSQQIIVRTHAVIMARAGRRRRSYRHRRQHRQTMASSMRLLHYGGGPDAVHLDDRALAHLKVVIATKLRRVEAFWGEYAERFTWDFVPMEVVHEIYTGWMRRRHPSEEVLTRTAFSKLLRQILPDCGDWRYTRARTGALTRVHEPLAQKVSWRPDDSNAAIYGLRRRAA